MKYVIIGNSAAAIGTVEGIRQIDTKGEIVLISNETHHTYSRPLISYFLKGSITEEKMKYRNDDFYKNNNCTLITGEKVTSVNVSKKQVITESNRMIDYDKLMIAAGASAFVPNIKGLNKVSSQYTFMTADDAKALKSAVTNNTKVLILGAGLIGLKCAEGLIYTTNNITVADVSKSVLSSILDKDGAAQVQKHLEEKGIVFKFNQSVVEFEENTAILGNGEKITFDVLVLATGVRPNIALMEGIAQINKGIVIDERMQTTCPCIYAAGDCTESMDISSNTKKLMPLLPNAYIQGETAGINMAEGSKVFNKAIPMNAINFMGINIITAGSYEGDVYTENSKNGYKKLFYENNCLKAFILVGNIEKAGIYTALIREKMPLDEINFELIKQKPALMAFSKAYRTEKLGGMAK